MIPQKNNYIKALRFVATLLGFGFLFCRTHKEETTKEVEPILSGKKTKLIREYPLIKAKLTKGKVYDIVDEYTPYKQVTYGAKIPLNLMSIVNDEGEVIMVTKVYFEDVNIVY